MLFRSLFASVKFDSSFLYSHLKDFCTEVSICALLRILYHSVHRSYLAQEYFKSRRTRPETAKDCEPDTDKISDLDSHRKNKSSRGVQSGGVAKKTQKGASLPELSLQAHSVGNTGKR